MKGFASALTTLLLVMNTFSGIVSGIWLAFLGQWWAFGYGLTSLFAPMLLGLVLAPSLLLAAPAGTLIEKGERMFAAPLLFLTQAYQYGVISLWCLFIFHVFVGNATSSTLWPLLLWSYGIAFGPLRYMAASEQGTDGAGTKLSLCFTQIAYVAMVIATVASDHAILPLFVFSAFIFIGVCLHTNAVFSAIDAAAY